MESIYSFLKIWLIAVYILEVKLCLNWLVCWCFVCYGGEKQQKRRKIYRNGKTKDRESDRARKFLCTFMYVRVKTTKTRNQIKRMT